MSKADLRLDWCSYQAAKWAVEHWHYSGVMPAGKASIVGAYERGKYIGCVVFSRGANNHIGSPYGLSQMQVCELTRVALTDHESSVSRVVSIAVKMLHRQSPGLRLIVSYADPLQDHHGGIYQAMGWIYTGQSQAQRESLRPDGSILHKKSAHSLFGSIVGLPKSAIMWKYKYLYPLDDAMRKQIEPLRKPYPKRVPRGSGEIDNAADTNLQTGGARPTDPLSNVDAVQGLQS